MHSAEHRSVKAITRPSIHLLRARPEIVATWKYGVYAPGDQTTWVEVKTPHLYPAGRAAGVVRATLRGGSSQRRFRRKPVLGATSPRPFRAGRETARCAVS